MTYMEYACQLIEQVPVGTPIYTKEVANKFQIQFDLSNKQASAAASVAFKRIMDSKILSDLRFYQKGIYYKTTVTPFGERGINKEQLIADKYLIPDRGYETGLTLLNRMGLVTQMPKEVIIATNIAKECVRTDKKLGVVIRPPRTEINGENKAYLQTLDALELLDKSPVDAEKPYCIIADFIKNKGLHYDKLLYFADRFYNRNTIIQLAHTASEGGYA